MLTETAEFRTINGELIHVLPQQRHEVRKVITHLLTKGESPDKGDYYLKQLHLLRYIKSCPDIGPTFSADPTNYPNFICETISNDRVQFFLYLKEAF